MFFWRNWFKNNRNAGKACAEHIKTIMAAELRDGECRNDPSLPAHLIELKDSYENAMASRYEDGYLRPARKMAAKLDVLCIEGIENIQLMRSGLFRHLSVMSFMHKWGWAAWTLFMLALLGLTFLDFAPTTLVFNTLMEDEAIQGMICMGNTSVDDYGATVCNGQYLVDRSSIIFLSISAFLVCIVMIGHVLAKIFFGEYFDRNVSVLGKGLLAVVTVVFFLLSGIRYVHEERVAVQLYESTVNQARQADLMAQTPESKAKLEYLESEDGKSAIIGEQRLKNIFASALFSIMSLMILLGAIYLSLWHQHGDIGYLIRQRKFITTRIEVERIRTELENIYNRYKTTIAELRQSAQREVAEFFIGVEETLVSDSADSKQELFSCIRKMREAFNKSLDIPDSISDPSGTRLPESELDWGVLYRSYLENVLFYDAFEKGAQDAVNLGEANPDSALSGMSTSLQTDSKWRNAHPNISDKDIQKQYAAGFVEGSKVKYGNAWKMAAESQPTQESQDKNRAASPTAKNSHTEAV